MCPALDVGSQAVVARMLYGSPDVEWLGRTGVITDVCYSFRTLQTPDGQWCVRFVEELDAVGSPAGDDSPTAAGEYGQGKDTEIAGTAPGTGGVPGGEVEGDLADQDQYRPG